MLIPAAEQDLHRYGHPAYLLSQDPTASCYPSYRDGIKTEADFLAAARQALESDTAELLLYVQGGVPTGWLSYFWLSEDRYLQLDSCCIADGTAQALTELLDRLSARFPGYTLYFGYPAENRVAARTLFAHGFSLLERSWDHSFSFAQPGPERLPPNVRRITRECFSLFRALYRPEPGTYWTCDRILAALEDWIIFVSGPEDAPEAAILLTGADRRYEVFGTAYSGGSFREDSLRTLLTACLAICRQQGAAHLTFFCGAEERPVLSALGFRCIGQYMLYSKAL